MGWLCLPVTLFLSMSMVMLTACGGSSSSHTSSAPIFTSVPVTEASQGVAYSYQMAATDPSGGSVTFALTTSPLGATLSGNTVAWTPTADESRVSNNFTATATSSSGGNAQQSWTVTPNGTVTVNWVNTYWSPGGPVQVPALAPDALNIEALVPQSDGSITLLKGSATSTPGLFTIFGVPAGNYWLAAGGGGAFYTSTSSFDAGTDIAGGQVPVTSTSYTTTFNFNLDVVSEASEEWVEYFSDPPTGAVLFGLVPGSTTLGGGVVSGGNIDWSQINTAFLMQYVPETLGTQNAYVLGPELTLTNLAFTNGTTNTISGTLNAATDVSQNLSVTGSQWAPIFNNVGPAAATVQDSILTVLAEPYVIGVNANPQSSLLPALTLVAPSPGALGFIQQGQGFVIDPIASICADYTGSQATNLLVLNPPILTDQNLGALQYGDPFDSTWTRALAFCQQATVSIPIPNSSDTYSLLLVDGGSVAPSDTPLAPVALPVQNPTVNGSNLFTANTITTTAPVLSWTAPSGNAPYGYKVHVYVLTTINNAPGLQSAGIYSTSGTSVTLPPLAGGNTYVFTITTEMDGVANMQTSPYRSALPTGFASVVSAPIAISPSAATSQIRGDIEDWRQAVNPKHDSRMADHGDAPVFSDCAAVEKMQTRVVCE